MNRDGIAAQLLPEICRMLEGTAGSDRAVLQKLTRPIEGPPLPGTMASRSATTTGRGLRPRRTMLFPPQARVSIPTSSLLSRRRTPTSGDCDTEARV